MAATGLSRRAARAAQPIRIGVLTEMGGPYAEDSGLGSVASARFAVEDFRRVRPDLAVEVIYADAQHGPISPPALPVRGSIATAWT